jgi:uncharacterized protein (DUF697 family)
MQFKNFWVDLRDAIFYPRVSDAELSTKIGEIRRQLPSPVFWLLGKTQAGKSSIVRTLTGATTIEIGNGFQACTRTARFYDFPSPERSLIRFLDTRGLGEAAYDPTEDMAWCKQYAHLLIAVLKVLDQAQQEVVRAIHQIHKAQPQWPIIVAQTALHEGYASREVNHIEPYPYATFPLPSDVPDDLARALLQQREWLTGIDAHFVPIDFTLPEDGYSPIDYGLEPLWTAIETALPLGLPALLRRSGHFQVLRDTYAEKSHPHIVGYAITAGLLATIPPPADIPFLLATQAKMFHSIAAIYNQKLTPQVVTEFAGHLGLGRGLNFLGKWGVRELVKLIPTYGQTVGAAASALYAAAITYALGKTLCAYFSRIERGALLDKAMLQQIYEDEVKTARQLFRERFRISNKHSLITVKRSN